MKGIWSLKLSTLCCIEPVVTQQFFLLNNFTLYCSIIIYIFNFLKKLRKVVNPFLETLTTGEGGL